MRHGFSCINVCQVSREVLKIEAKAEISNSSWGTWQPLMYLKTLFGHCYWGLPLYAIISMQNELNPFLCHPAVLDCWKLFSFTITFIFTRSWHHEICKQYCCDICFTTRWRCMHILKVRFPCIISAWLSLLIHSFLPVNSIWHCFLYNNKVWFKVRTCWST